MSDTSFLQPDSFCALAREHLKDYFAMHGHELPPSGLYTRFLTEMERCVIQETLDAVQGNQLQAAKVLGINRNTLRKKITELGIAWSR